MGKTINRNLVLRQQPRGVRVYDGRIEKNDDDTYTMSAATGYRVGISATVTRVEGRTLVAQWETTMIGLIEEAYTESLIPGTYVRADGMKGYMHSEFEDDLPEGAVIAFHGWSPADYTVVFVPFGSNQAGDVEKVAALMSGACDEDEGGHRATVTAAGVSLTYAMTEAEYDHESLRFQFVTERAEAAATAAKVDEQVAGIKDVADLLVGYVRTDDTEMARAALVKIDALTASIRTNLS